MALASGTVQDPGKMFPTGSRFSDDLDWFPAGSEHIDL
jgi:hypothetical protein